MIYSNSVSSYLSDRKKPGVGPKWATKQRINAKVPDDDEDIQVGVNEESKMVTSREIQSQVYANYYNSQRHISYQC